MKSKLFLAAAALMGAVFAASSAAAVTFNITGGASYDLHHFDPSPAAPGLGGGTTVWRGATLGLSGAGRVTASYVGAEAAYRNEFWLNGARLFDNKTAGQAPVSLDLTGGTVPFAFKSVKPAGTAANGTQLPDFRGTFALYRINDTAVYALFNDSANDKDFDDMAVRLDVAPIPLPAAAWLLMGGLGALGAAGRRKRAAA